jgi:hypothetical protein
MHLFVKRHFLGVDDGDFRGQLVVSVARVV